MTLTACQSQLPDRSVDAPRAEKTTQPATMATEQDDLPTTLANAPLTTEFFTDHGNPWQCMASTREPAVKTPPKQPYNTVWQRIKAGYQLNWRVEHPRIDAQFDWYASHPGYMWRVTERSAPYIHYVVEQIEARGMPMEIALLPIVESAFDPFAYSHGRASGMWQFIPGTARHYGLKRTWWYDGRRDVVASTRAALDYLENLHQRFDGNWLLALAAYNSGQGTVGRAIRRNKKRGEPTDFWHLDLPRETEAYVPKLLALAKLTYSPGSHDVAYYPVANTAYFDVIPTESQIDLAAAATMAGMNISDLYRLNPGFNRWATDPAGPHYLVIPKSRSDRFKNELAKLPTDQRVQWERYTIKNGDSLITIARRFNTDVNTLKQVNNLKGNLIRAGKPLLIPVASQKASHYTLSAAQRLAKKQNHPRKGEKVFYVVKPGDSFWTISRRFNVNHRKLAKWNGMAPTDILTPGKKLVVWSQSSEAVQLARNERSPMIRKVGYRVRSGDSLARIAGKFNLRINDILKWNPINPEAYLQPGQHLTLYIDVTKGIN